MANKVHKNMNNKRQILSAIIAVLISVGLVATAVYATTTIGNNVDVGGTLDVTGATTLDSTLTVTATTTLNGTFVIGTSASPMTLAAAGTRAIDVWTTYGLTSGLSKSVTIDAVGTEAGGDVRAFDAGVHSQNVRLGNATGVVGKVYLENTGGVSGLAASLFGYLKMFNSASTAQGTYVPLNLAIEAPASFSGGTTMAFIRFELTGSKTYLDDMVRLFNLTGLTDETGHLLYNNTLKMKVNTTTWYMPLSSAEGSYTTAYPIVSTYSGVTGIEIGAATRGINIDGATTGIRMRNVTTAMDIEGPVKIHDHSSATDYGIQLRSESTKTSGTHVGIDSETHLDATGTTSIRGVQGVAKLTTGFTFTGNGSLVGIYGQARADGTFNAPGGFLTGVYGLIEASAAITASHVSSVWLDSHQDNTVTGEHELLYMTNNGQATMDQAIYVYGNNKITNLFNLDTVVGMVTGPGSAASGTPVKIRIEVNGTPYYINAYPTDN